MTSSKNGTATLNSEITNISQHSFWIYFNGKEYQISFDTFPWFKHCTIQNLFNYTVDDYGNFYWPDLDVDLNIDIIENPHKYPLLQNEP
jgi:hypothetical protein